MRTMLIWMWVWAGAMTLGRGAEVAPVLHLVGDSTMATKPLDLPERGWGMALHGLMLDPAMVHNHAMNGRSTKSFLAEGRWARVASLLRPGDFVIIQFGHNDEKVDRPEVGTDAATTFRDNLRRFIRETRAKQATPMLATPVARRKFDRAGKLTPTHGAYPDAIRAVAAEEAVALLDLERATAEWLQAAGDEPSKKFFMWIAPGAHPKIPDGRKDDTHFTEAGALKVAELAGAQIKAQKLELATWVR